MPRKNVRAQWAEKIKNGELKTSGTKLVPQSLKSEPFRGIVLGIDPSLRGSGLSVVDFTKGRNPVLLYSITVTNHPKLELAQCLAAIAKAIEHVISQFEITACGIEETIYVQNFQTAQILGAARGAAIATVAKHDIPVYHYSPLRIKQSVVGYGRASKEQVSSQIRSLLILPDNLNFDESDAAAVACCHAFSSGKVAMKR